MTNLTAANDRARTYAIREREPKINTRRTAVSSNRSWRKKSFELTSQCQRIRLNKIDYRIVYRLL